jgi:predicted DNA-binding protein
MAMLEKPVRQSVSLSPDLARRVKDLAKSKRTSANRVVVDLIEAGLEAQESEKRRFFDLADRLVSSTDVQEQQHLKEELARLTFGE